MKENEETTDDSGGGWISMADYQKTCADHARELAEQRESFEQIIAEQRAEIERLRGKKGV